MIRPRFSMIGSMLALVGLGMAQQKVAEPVFSHPGATSNGLLSQNLFGAGHARNGAKEWGMSAACARMVRKNRGLARGISAQRL